MYCKRCGASFEEKSVFCPECGAAVITDEDNTVAAVFEEKTEKERTCNPTVLGADTTLVADREEATAVSKDKTLIADSDGFTAADSDATPAADIDRTLMSADLYRTGVNSTHTNENKKKNTAIIAVAIIAVVIAAVAAVLLAFKSKSDSKDETAESVTGLSTEAVTDDATKQSIPEDIVVMDVPELNGKNVEEAEQILISGNITYEIIEAFSDDVEAGKIISQFPEGGSQVTPETLIHITVSIGKEESVSSQNSAHQEQKVIPAEYAVITPSSATLLPSQTAKIKVKIYPENATSKDYIIASDNYIVASIDDDNNVMAISSGSTTLRVLAPDGTELGKMKVTVSEPATQPPAPAPTKATVQAPSPTKAPAPVATQAPRYKISLDANGGSLNIASVTVKHNGTYENLPTPARSGYTFDGWYTTGGARVTSSSEIAYNYDHTLKAQWTASSCALTLDANGGYVSTSSLKVNYGSSVNLPTPKRDYYTFKGWYTDRSGGTQVTSSTKIYSSDTLYARWAENSYTDWSTSAPPSNVSSSQIKTRTLYSYRDKETTTSSSSSLGNGWTLEDTTSSTGSWSSWSKTKPADSANREIETKKVEDKTTKTQYAYKRYKYYNKSEGKYYLTYGETWAKNQGYSGSWEYKVVDSELSYVESHDGKKAYGKKGDFWYKADVNTKQGTKYTTFKITTTVVSGSHTEYRYRDTTYTYYYYRWSDWSDWSTSSYSKSSTRDVKTQTQYSYRPI